MKKFQHASERGFDFAIEEKKSPASSHLIESSTRFHVYNIPVSVSVADTSPQDTQITTGTTFNFSSPFARGSIFDVEQTPVSTATATSSASTGGGASSQTKDSGNAQVVSEREETNWGLFGIVGFVAVLILVIVWKKL